ncbi:MAG: sigma-E processing peptidase SpoIIGA [Clostridia bacterium]
MTVYIEYVLIDNMVIDSILLAITSVTLKEKLCFWRLLCGALFGTITAVILSLITLNSYIGLILKLFVGFLMTLITVEHYTKKLIIQHYLVFLAYTFSMGGVILGLLYLIQANVYNALTLNYTFGVPIGVIVGGVAVSIALGVKVAKNLYKKRALSGNRLLPVTVIFDKEYSIVGFHDSGNLVQHNGLPVFFAVGKKFKAVLVGIYTENLLTKENKWGENTYVHYTTLSGSAHCLALKPIKTTVNGKDVDCLIAFGNITSDEYDIIINYNNF